MRCVLVTGFEPFGGETVNPSWLTAKELPDTVAGYRVEKLLVPVEFGVSGRMLCRRLEELQPDAVLCLGQAGGRAALTVERVAINVMDASQPDNAGFLPQDQPVRPGGPAAYFSTLPLGVCVEMARQAGVPAAVSNTAGTYVCNQLLYAALDWAAQTGWQGRAGFVHLPWLPGQVLNRPGQPSMELETMVRGVQAVLEGALAFPDEGKGEQDGSGRENP